MLVVVAALGMGQVSPWKAYELYSWQGVDGGWNFCMLPSPSGVNVTAKQVFGSKRIIRGVSELRRRIATLSPETTVFWLDRFTDTGQKSGQGGTLTYPTSEVVMEVKRQAESHKIKLEVSSDSQVR
jgi:hypothetical protein